MSPDESLPPHHSPPRPNPTVPPCSVAGGEQPRRRDGGPRYRAFAPPLDPERAVHRWPVALAKQGLRGKTPSSPLFPSSGRWIQRAPFQGGVQAVHDRRTPASRICFCMVFSISGIMTLAVLGSLSQLRILGLFADPLLKSAGCVSDCALTNSLCCMPRETTAASTRRSPHLRNWRACWG